MKKEAYYFSHDSNARNDEKILAVRMRLGAEGYGIYFMIIERLRDDSENISIKDYNILAFDFRVSSDKVKSIVEDFGLFEFTEDGCFFYSKRMKESMKIKNEKSLKARESINKRWGKDERNTNVLQTYNERNTIKGKETKVKELLHNSIKEKEKEEKEIPPPYSGNRIDEFEKECLESSEMWLSQIAKTLGLTSVEEAKFWVAKYFQEMRARDEILLSLKNAKSHCFNWAKIEIQKEKDRVTKQQATQQPVKGKALFDKIMNIQME